MHPSCFFYFLIIKARFMVVSAGQSSITCWYHLWLLRQYLSTVFIESPVVWIYFLTNCVVWLSQVLIDFCQLNFVKVSLLELVYRKLCNAEKVLSSVIKALIEWLFVRLWLPIFLSFINIRLPPTFKQRLYFKMKKNT